ncbi:MAG: hypothetical protein H7839_00945 [Magnetococcus sp. YQC-5]
MLTFADRVKENATVTGTSAYTLAGAVAGFQSFGSAFSDGARLQYCAESGTQWEVGEGTFNSASINSANGTVSRDTVLSSSNSGAVVNWPSGSVKIFCIVASSAIQRSTNQGLVVTTPGTLVALDGNTRWYAQQNIRFSSMDAWVGGPSAESDIQFTIRKNSALALSGSIVSGAFRMLSIEISLSMNAEDWLTLDITQVGAATPGKNLSVRLTP